MALDNKISNIIGAAMPQWLKNQLKARSEQNSKDSRDDKNLLYLANKTAWVRLISSVNLNGVNIKEAPTADMKWFSENLGITLTTPDDLAKKYILYGGTSKYLKPQGAESFSYELRSGVEKDGAYGMLGEKEVSEYGYRPMPGIIDARIETQGKLGSVRMATVSFKVWNKMQLDIMDTLYFKLGYTMLLEWANTVYYTEDNSNKLSFQYSELDAIDPFAKDMDKEKIQLLISQNIRKTQGNYDAMLGIVTNFNFSFNQEGGYDCTVKIISLGALGDSIKINNPTALPEILKSELKDYVAILNKLEADKKAQEEQKTIDEENKKVQIAIDAQKEVNKAIPSFSEIISPTTTGLLTDVYDSSSPTVPNKIFKFLGLTGEKYNNDTFLSLNKSKSLIRLAAASIENTEIQLDIIKANVIASGINSDKVNRFLTDMLFVPNQIRTKAETNQFGAYKNPTAAITGGTISTPTVDTTPRYPVTASWASNTLKQDYPTPDYFGTNNNLKSDTESKNYGKTNRSLWLRGGIDYQLSYGPLFSIGLYIDTYAQVGSDKIVNLYKKELEYKPEQKLDGSYNLDYKEFTYFENENVKTIWNNGYGDILLKVESFNNGKSVEDLIKEAINSPEKWTLNDITTYTQLQFIEAKKSISINVPMFKIMPGKIDPGSKKVKNTLTIELKTAVVEIRLRINDLDLIKNVYYKKPDIVPIGREYQQYQLELDSQNKLNNKIITPEYASQETLSAQVTSALKLQSNLELTLKAIQLYALNNVIKTQSPDGLNQVIELKMDNSTSELGKFYQSIFKYGVYKSFLTELIDNKIDSNLNNEKDDSWVTSYKNLPSLQKLKISAKYGFSTAILGGHATANDITTVDYKDLMSIFVVPYEPNKSIDGGIKILYSTYVQLGMVLMILNDMCTIYDTDKSNQSKPLIYIDYNPETNRCLSSPQQFTSNAFDFLIPFQSTLEDYKTLFPKDTLISDTNNIQSDVASSLFIKSQDDQFSDKLPKFRSTDDPKGAYSGKTMKVLISIDYILDLVKEFSLQDGSNSVYLKQFIEKLLKDMNNYLGNVNVFRLAYTDSANTYSIVDDQFQPLVKDQEYVNSNNATDEIPLFGKKSIAKSVSIQTEISSKLSNMLAISSNSNPSDQSSLSTNATPFGFINNSYSDRYVPNKGDQKTQTTGSQSSKEQTSLRQAAEKFNSTIKSYYGINPNCKPSRDNISQATNFYISGMSKQMAENPATRAAAMIPVSLTFATDGISGFHMGQSFTIPEQLLPYTYTNRSTTYLPEKTNKVGFAAIGVTHEISNNVWQTTVKGNMILIKDPTIFQGSKLNASKAAISTTNIASNQYQKANITNVKPSDIINNLYIPTLDKTFPNLSKGIKTLMAAQTQLEGFKPGTKSYDNNNPGNINTYGTRVQKYPTLELGITAQWNEVLNPALNNKSGNYKPTNSLFEYLSIYAPVDDKSAHNDPSYYTNFVISFFKKRGIQITEKTTLKEINAIV